MLCSLAGPFPKFDGIAVDIPPSAPRSDAGASSPPPGATGSVRVPPLNPDDVVKFTSLFEKSGGTNGIISGAYELSAPLHLGPGVG